MKRTFVLAAVAAGVALTLAGCSGTTVGTPTATDSAGSVPSSTAQGTSDNWWQSIDSCSLLSATSAVQLGLPAAGKPDIQSQTENGCKWSSTGHVLVTLTSQAYNTLVDNGGKVSDISVGNRLAQQEFGAGGPGECDVSVQATKGSRALIVATTDSNSTDQACQLARGVAAAIASKLPSAG